MSFRSRLLTKLSKMSFRRQRLFASVLRLTFTTSVLFFCSAAAMFSNEIDKPNGDKIVEYDFVVEHRISMVTFDKTRGTGRPVLSLPSGFVKRAEPSVDKRECSKLLNVTDEEYAGVLIGDGSYKKVFAINGQIPGPPIVVTEGTQVVVRVHNRLIQEGITLHWHGMVQRKTPYMDGVGSVSQCPIAPGETFIYRFLAYPLGTHWYHSHLGTTRSDGLYGPLIVLPTEDQVRFIDGRVVLWREITDQTEGDTGVALTLTVDEWATFKPIRAFTIINPHRRTFFNVD